MMLLWAMRANLDGSARTQRVSAEAIQTKVLPLHRVLAFFGGFWFIFLTIQNVMIFCTEGTAFLLRSVRFCMMRSRCFARFVSTRCKWFGLTRERLHRLQFFLHKNTKFLVWRRLRSTSKCLFPLTSSSSRRDLPLNEQTDPYNQKSVFRGRPQTQLCSPCSEIFIAFQQVTPTSFLGEQWTSRRMIVRASFYSRSAQTTSSTSDRSCPLLQVNFLSNVEHNPSSSLSGSVAFPLVRLIRLWKS